jgi:putative ABC transport system permease protein
MEPRASRSEKLYRLLLRLFPAEFREEYGEDVVQLFLDRRAEIAGSRRSRAAFWIRSFADLILEAARERAHRMVPSRKAERRGSDMVDALRQDSIYAFRTLSRTPGFTAMVVVTFALAIGANTAIFSVLNDVLLEPLPFGHPEELVAVWETSPREGIEKSDTSAGLFLDWGEKNQCLKDLTAWTWDSVVLEGDFETTSLNAVLVYPNFFSFLEIEPLFGRAFIMQDAPPVVASAEGKPGVDRPPRGGTGKVVIVSHALWRDRLGADPSVVGTSLRIDGEAHTVVGVMRPDVAAPDAGADLWIPYSFQSPVRWERYVRRFVVYGRLRAGVAIGAAQEDFSRIAEELRSGEYRDIYEHWDALLVPLREEIVGNSRPALLTALAAVGVVLLIACVNIANLLLARSAGRRREMALRTAMGASRGRVIGTLLTESLLLAAAGGTLGLGVARVTHQALLRFQPGILPRVEELSLDLWALGFASVLTALSGVLFGLAPVTQTLRLHVQRFLQQGGGRSTTEGRAFARTRAALVTAQLALATVLLCGAGLLVRTLTELERVDPGFRAEDRLALRLFLDTRRYDTGVKVADYYARLADRLSQLPEVAAVGASTALPMDPVGISYDLPYRLEGQEELDDNELPQASFRVVTPGYFEALGASLVAGRTFDRFDRPESPMVALVNETMARQVWPRGGAIGSRFETPSTDWNWFEVVGVVSDTRFHGLRSDPRPEIYVAHAQVPRANMTFVLETRGDAPSLASTLRREVLEQDPSQPTHSLVAMADLVAETVKAEKFYTTVLSLFSALALTLAASGVFAVLSYWVAGRTHEIGLRMALGASRSAVTREVLSKGLALGFLGAGLGLLAALFSTRVVESVLFHVSATDGATFGGVALLLLSTALCACAIPALRASRVDPMVALREE